MNTRPGDGAAAAPLRVLVAHNRYQQRGGEDAVVESEVELLRRHGHEVREYSRDNHDLDRMGRADAAAQTLWSARTVREAGALLAEFRPHVLHVHNTFPLISPSIYWAAHRHGVPVVQTLHNFRLVCPQALMLRDGRPCEDCVGRPLPWPGVVHACYRDSRAQTGVLAAMLAAHRLAGTWRHRIARYIALNEFCRERFVAGGLPADRLRVKPNFVDLPAPDADDAARAGFLFVGRLSAEKGIDVLADAVRLDPAGEPIAVAGDGPRAALLDGIERLRRLGALPAGDVARHMRRARALVLPSLWYENFPRTLVEAYACGLPVVASRLGAMVSLVEDGTTGLLFDPGSAGDLAAKLAWASAHPEALAEMGRAARRHYEREWTGDANHRQLVDIYRDAMAAGGNGRPAA